MDNLSVSVLLSIHSYGKYSSEWVNLDCVCYSFKREKPLCNSRVYIPCSYIVYKYSKGESIIMLALYCKDIFPFAPLHRLFTLISSIATYSLYMFCFIRTRVFLERD